MIWGGRMTEINGEIYLNVKESRAFLGFSRKDKFQNLVNEYNLTHIPGKGTELLYKKSDLEFFLKLREEWHNRYILVKEAKKILGVCTAYDVRQFFSQHNIIRYKSPIYLIEKSSHHFYVDKFKLEKVKHLRVGNVNIQKNILRDQKQLILEEKQKTILTQIKEKKYLSYVESTERLQVSNHIFRKIVTEYNLKYCFIGENSGKYYSTNDIDRVLKYRFDFFKEYITTQMAINTYGSDILHSLKKKLNHIKLPIYCVIQGTNMSGNDYAYKISEIEAYIYERNLIQTVYNTFGKNCFDTVSLRIELYSTKLELLENSTYTKQKWLETIKTFFNDYDDEKPNRQSVNDKINDLVNLTLDLELLLKSNNATEIYSLTPTIINMWFRTISGTKRKWMYFFIQAVCYDIKIQSELMNFHNRTLTIDKIYRYNDNIFKKSNSNDKNNTIDVYDYDTYLKLFKYLINMPLHIKKSLDYIEKFDSDISYISTWLYTLLHLNNGWRNSDIITFPRLYFKDLLYEWNIDNLNWFKENTLSLAMCKRVIARIMSYEFRISKTQVYGHFFCSDALAPALVTAILMLECVHQNGNIVSSNDYEKESLMRFYNKYNKPSERQLKTCFSEFEIKKFEFQSLKMNKTVLTLIYNTACAISPSGYNALILPKYLRAHLEDMSTIQYINFTTEQLEFLSGELFERNSFGFITDALLDLISDKSETSLPRTQDIKNINILFGNIHKIEATVGMLNYFSDERTEIMEMINNELLKDKTIEEIYNICVETLTNIYMGNLPSKTPNIQCLFSQEGCKCPNIKCIDCKYRIPNMYLLKTICIGIQEDIIGYEKTNNLCTKIKLSSKIHNKIGIIKYAINKYGHDYVYGCMDTTREKFLNSFGAIPKADKIIELM